MVPVEHEHGRLWRDEIAGLQKLRDPAVRAVRDQARLRRREVGHDRDEQRTEEEAQAEDHDVAIGRRAAQGPRAMGGGAAVAVAGGVGHPARSTVAGRARKTPVRGPRRSATRNTAVSTSTIVAPLAVLSQ